MNGISNNMLNNIFMKKKHVTIMQSLRNAILQMMYKPNIFIAYYYSTFHFHKGYDF